MWIAAVTIASLALTAQSRAMARPDEAKSTGCIDRLRACPVDTIVGAHQYVHTAIKAECAGCELCVAPCPLDCISMETVH